ncbi:MAG TPA: type IV secretory system conjugative DNA transfer family protein, partial [Gammaproteobacteria bacterium]|nr:type IV secretory system conjugative DNA transfer family protein [Gammaproteobacteria bacterium]
MLKFRKALFGILCIIAFSFIEGCATQTETKQLDELRELKPFTTDTLSVTGLRHIALRDTALSLGARGGLAWRAEHINKRTLRYSRYLDRTFNFNAMLLEHHVLPPVLIEGRKTLEQGGPDTLRIAERAYVINTQAQFVTTTPTWRDYILLKFMPPEKPDQSLLPRSDMEQQVWDRYIREG